MSWRESSSAPYCEVGVEHKVWPFSLVFRKPTWTRVTRVALLVVGLLATPACSFKDYDYQPSVAASGGAPGATSTADAGATGGASGTHDPNAAATTGGASGVLCPGDSGAYCDPACIDEDALADSQNESMLEHWTFPDDSQSWLVSDQGHSLQLSPPATDNEMQCSTTRINGKGYSLYLDGRHHAYYSAAQTSWLQKGFTLSAWVSMRHDWLETMRAQRSLAPDNTVFWPLFVTVDPLAADDCGRYQLGIRLGAHTEIPVLVLSYNYRLGTDAAATCLAHEVSYQLQLPSWSWGPGIWHHVGGTYTATSTNLTKPGRLELFWDLDSVSRDGMAPDGSLPSPTSDSATLFVGGSEKSNTINFSGYLDEIAIFTKPLTLRELKSFALNTTTQQGPSGCRWNASEAWDDRVDASASSVTSFDSWAKEASVRITDRDWGAGYLNARVSLDLRAFRFAHVTAEIPSQHMFEFMVAGRDFYCSWIDVGKGEETDYQFDLANPSNCESLPGQCTVDLANIEKVSIGSAWAIPCHYQSDCQLKVTPALQFFIESEQLIVSKLEFQRAGHNALDGSAYGGAIGPNNWCWRPLVYEPGASAGLDPGKTISTKSLTAVLQGPPYSGSRIVADFGDPGLDISNCTDATIGGVFGQNGTGDYKFLVQDVAGSWATGALICTESSCTFNPKVYETSSTDEIHRTSNFHGFPTVFNYQNVRFFGLQKNWDADWLSRPRTPEITSVQLLDEHGESCVPVWNP